MELPQNNKIYTYEDYKGFDEKIKIEIIDENIYFKIIKER